VEAIHKLCNFHRRPFEIEMEPTIGSGQSRNTHTINLKDYGSWWKLTGNVFIDFLQLLPAIIMYHRLTSLVNWWRERILFSVTYQTYTNFSTFCTLPWTIELLISNSKISYELVAINLWTDVLPLKFPQCEIQNLCIFRIHKIMGWK